MFFEQQSFASATRAAFSIRMLKYFFAFMMLWQDSMVGHSPLQIQNFVAVPGLGAAELMTALLFVVVLIERSMTLDFTIRRSYFNGPLLLLLVAFYVSWLMGCFMRQQYAPRLEAHEVFAWPLIFVVVNNAFRSEEDRVILFKLLMLAVIPKAMEGVGNYFEEGGEEKFWGVLQLWRDGYLLALGSVSAMLLAQYRGELFRKTKRTLLWSMPIVLSAFILSYRRTFMLATLFSAIVLAFTLPKEMRRRHIWIALAVIFGMITFALVTNPIGIIARFYGIVAPQHEGSAYIRLMEWPNVIENIRRHPFFGVPVGVQWTAYYRMPVSSVYTTLGTHDTYFYFQLRAGIAGSVGFLWIMARLWKTAILNLRLARNEDDELIGRVSVQMLVIYNFGCFFGLMYGDIMPVFLGVIFTAFQLQTRHIFGRFDLKPVSFLRSYRAREVVFVEPKDQLYNRAREAVLRLIDGRRVAA